MRQAAAAGFFPGEVLIVERDVVTRAGELRAAHGSGWPAAYDRNFAHAHRLVSEERRRIDCNVRQDVRWAAFGEYSINSAAPKARWSGKVGPVETPATSLTALD
jgi:hypothetical protein